MSAKVYLTKEQELNKDVLTEAEVVLIAKLDKEGFNVNKGKKREIGKNNGRRGKLYAENKTQWKRDQGKCRHIW